MLISTTKIIETEITVRIVKDTEGYFIARAVGYLGVISFGRSEDEVMSDIREIWFAMAHFNAIKNIGDSKRPIYSGATTEKKLSAYPKIEKV
jgi:predicted RNase H-like HicB family nuclease